MFIKWFKEMRDKNDPVSGSLLQCKGKHFAVLLKMPDAESFSIRNGWLYNFKINHITFCTVCCEDRAVDEDMYVVSGSLPLYPWSYYPGDVFSADETGLFFKCLLDKSMTLRGKTCQNGTFNKKRMILLLATNMDGSEKMVPLMIGKSRKPRCFSK